MITVVIFLILSVIFTLSFVAYLVLSDKSGNRSFADVFGTICKFLFVVFMVGGIACVVLAVGMEVFTNWSEMNSVQFACAFAICIAMFGMAALTYVCVREY